MKNKFINAHIHIFNTDCAPRNFLRIIHMPILQYFPGTIKWVLDQKRIRQLIGVLHRILKFKKTRSGLSKYISFLNVGTQNTQYDIFDMAWQIAKNENADAGLIALTLNMDHMDNQGPKPLKSFESQLEEIKQIKRYHPDHFFPFLGVDPRAKSGNQLVTWAQKYLTEGIQSQETKEYYPFFCGIKMYPALGFFPFDPRFDELYAYAEKNGIPIMSHCTRGGSQYVGSNIKALIPKKPSMINPGTSPAFTDAQKNIYDRIQRFYDKKWIKNSKIGNNFKACDLFGHPQNYIPVMLKYPKLKICLAHMGGSDEMILKKDASRAQKIMWKTDQENWAELTKKLMIEYDFLYTDISYSLSDLTDDHIKNEFLKWLSTTDKNGNLLSQRVLFGTDFYMTEREKKETELYALAKTKLIGYYEGLTTSNIATYLKQK